MAAHATARPEPMLTRARIVAALSGLVTALVMFGVLPVALGDDLQANVEVIVGALSTLVSVVPALVHATVSRSVVTPVADPRTDDGVELVPAGSAPATLDAAVALAEADAIHPA